MLVVRNIEKSFAGRAVLTGVDFSLEESALVGLIGPSGGGKSVLLKIIGGVEEPDAGTVDTGVGTSLSLMFQEGALFDSFSVFDNVAFPLVQGRVPAANLSGAEKDMVYTKVSEILARVGLTKAAHKMPGQISGGMRRRTSLARALVTRPQLLLLDDPTSGLDPVASSVIMELIVEMHSEYRPTTVIVSHDLRRLFPAVQSVVGLFGGKVTFHNTRDELMRAAPEQIARFVSCRYDLRGGA